MKKIVILGATGSIGKNALSVAKARSDLFLVAGVQANSSKKSLCEISSKFGCPSTLTQSDGLEGIGRLLDFAKPDIVLNGIAGAAGLLPSKMVLERGIDLALANKETVVMAWDLVKRLAKKTGAKIIPVDSEHSAVFNLIRFCKKKNVSKIILTASGGPFRNFSREQLEKATLSDALKHPTWKMGKKITVDSATLANKGLEVIEACRLFALDAQNVQVAIHPESLVHSFVQTCDSVLYAQISKPDMKGPIFSALSYPKIQKNSFEEFSIFEKTMSFYRPRSEDFPLLDEAYSAQKKGPLYTVAFNAADEVAASAFLKGKISFLKIAEVVQKVLQKNWEGGIKSFDAVFEADAAARKIAESFA